MNLKTRHLLWIFALAVSVFTTGCSDSGSSKPTDGSGADKVAQMPAKPPKTNSANP